MVGQRKGRPLTGGLLRTFDRLSPDCGQQPSKGGSPPAENLVNYASLAYQEANPPAIVADLTSFANLLICFPPSSRTDGKVNPITLLGDPQVFGRIRARLAGLTGRVIAYVLLVDAVAAACVALMIVSGQAVGNWFAVAGLAVVACYGERGRITLRGHFTVSISLLPAIFAAVLFGPIAAMVVFGASGAGVSFPNLDRWVLTVGRMSYLGSRALDRCHGRGWGCDRQLVRRRRDRAHCHRRDSSVADCRDRRRRLRFVDLLASGLRQVDRRSEGLASRDHRVSSVLQPCRRHPRAFLSTGLSPWTLPLFFAPALAAQRWFLLYQEQRRLAGDLQVANDQLETANLSFAKGLIATLDARDRYTAGHSAAVAIYARDIARRMELGVEQEDLAYLCGLVHDIGKIGLPAGLLEKPGALTLEERKEMQRHSEIGEKILANVETYEEIASVVRHHHERVDGQGYPDGLASLEIPFLSRVIAVADAYNAMTSDRPYREAMPSRVARLRLAQAVETQFDTAVVAAFEAILAAANEEYRVARSSEFSFGSNPAPDVATPAIQLQAS